MSENVRKKCCNVNNHLFSTSNIMKHCCDLPTCIHDVIFEPCRELVFFMLPQGIQGERGGLGKVREISDSIRSLLRLGYYVLHP